MDPRHYRYDDQDYAIFAPIGMLMVLVLYAVFTWAMNGGLRQPNFDGAERRPMSLSEARAKIDAKSENEPKSNDPFVFVDDDIVVSAPTSVPASTPSKK